MEMAGHLAITVAAQEAARALAPTTDTTSQVIVGVVIVAVFALLTVEAAHRVLVAMSATGVLLAITYATPWRLITFEGIREALDINVLVLLAAMMAVVGVLKTTGVFEWAVARIIRRSGGRPLPLLTFIVVFTGLASAFLDNVTTVVFVTPMAIAVAQQAGLAPPAILLPMVMASNIGGTATLIGDPPNIMIGSGAGLTFLDFLEHLTLPCLLMLAWLIAYSRRYYGRDYAAARPLAGGASDDIALTDPRLARWLAVICGAILLGFFTHHATGMPPAVPALLGAAAALVVQDVLYLRYQHPSASERSHGILRVTAEDIEWPTLAFFGFLFIVVGAAVNTGLIGTLARGLEWAITNGGAAFGLTSQGTLLFAAILICWVSGVLSALIDNIPFVAVAIPVIARIIPSMPGDASVLWWALALGACLGGNGTPIGASANVTTVGMAERAGVRMTFREFVRFAAPMTAGTLVIASAWLAASIYLGALGTLALGAAIAVLYGLVVVVRGRRRDPVPVNG